MFKLKWLAFFSAILFLPATAFAVGSIGDMANSALKVMVLVIQVGFKIAIVLGIGFLIGSVVQYIGHRRNPVQVRISRPITLFILGWVLIAIPYIAQLSESSLVIEAVEREQQEEQAAKRTERERQVQEERESRRIAREQERAMNTQQATQNTRPAPAPAQRPKDDRGFY